MTRFQSLRYVIVPQAIRIVLPTVTNDFISLIKDSSLVSVITLVELTQVYMQLSTTYYDYLVPGLLVAGAYLLLGIPFIFLARWMEHHLAVEVSGKPVKRGITP
jgi:polar amino acid transport system substrate-binding protein